MKTLLRGYDEILPSSISNLLTVPAGHNYQLVTLILGNTSTWPLPVGVKINRSSVDYIQESGIVVPYGAFVVVDLDVSLSPTDVLKVSNDSGIGGYLTALVGGYDYS